TLERYDAGADRAEPRTGSTSLLSACRAGYESGQPISELSTAAPDAARAADSLTADSQRADRFWRWRTRERATVLELLAATAAAIPSAGERLQQRQSGIRTARTRRG